MKTLNMFGHLSKFNWAGLVDNGSSDEVLAVQFILNF